MNRKQNILIPPRAKPVFQEKPVPAGYPQIGDFFAVLYVAVTVIIMAYSSLYGMVPILVFYAIWFTHIRYKGKFILQPSRDISFLLMIMALSVISTAWSSYKEVTMKSASEYASMLACTIIVTRTVRLESFIKGLTLGASLVLVFSFLGGGIDSSLDYSFSAGIGSKNQVGLYAEIGTFTSMLYLLSASRLPGKILFSFLPLPVCLLSLYISHSASSVLTLLFILAVCASAYILTKFPRSMRQYLLIAGFFLAAAFSGAAIYLGWQDAVFASFGKNATLTGRTYLWQQGIAFGMQHPVLGTGYFAFWVIGQPLAEMLWFTFEITSRTGFHFHNLFVQSFVDLGMAGMLLFLTTFLLSCGGSLRYVTRNGVDLIGFYALGFSFMFITRAWVEVDVLGPFGIGPLLFFSILPRLAQGWREKATAPAAPDAPYGRPFRFPAQSALAQKNTS